MVDIRMPDGQVVRFPDDMTVQQIGGLIMRKYPRALDAAEQSGGNGGGDRHADRVKSEAVDDAAAADASSDPVGPILAVESIGDVQPRPDRSLHEVPESAEANRDEERARRRVDATGAAFRNTRELQLADLLSDIDRATLLTVLIKANGGRPLR